MKHLFIILLFIMLMTQCRKEKDQPINDTNTALTPYSISTPSYFPEIVLSSDNPLTVEGIALGRKLYYDPILSNNGNACASCHDQNKAFSNPVVNSLAHINLAWNHQYLWNGAVEGSMEDIMDFEVNEFFKTDVSKLNADPNYPALFKHVFNTSPIDARQVAHALAQFMRTQVSTNSRFDQMMRKEVTFTPSERNGYIIFNTERGDCFHCHSIGLFNDNGYHNIGLDSLFTGVGRGRYNVTGYAGDMGKFKTPTLRNIELTAPYMHDGRFATLEEVIEHYNAGVKRCNTLDPIFSKPNQLSGLQLTLQEKQDLLAFLKTLTDTSFINNKALGKP